MFTEADQITLAEHVPKDRFMSLQEKTSTRMLVQALNFIDRSNATSWYDAQTRFV